MANVPRVSVLMPVYNTERYLSDAVDSILTQTFTDYEFIIVDDGSTDSTWEILTRYDDPCIRLVRNENNIGLIGSLNRGLELARGEYIARMDADDISLPERLATQVQYLDSHPEVGVLGSDFQIIDEEGNPRGIKKHPREHGLVKWKLYFNSPFGHSTVMMRRQLVCQVDAYQPDMRHAEDYDLWRRLSYITRFANLPVVLLKYRMHKTRVSELHWHEQEQNCKRIRQMMLADILDEDVPDKEAYLLGAKKIDSVDDAVSLGRLVYRLYRAVMGKDKSIMAFDKPFVRKDAASRLFKLARPRIRDLRTWEILLLACSLDPALMLKTITFPFRRLTINHSRLVRNQCGKFS